MENLLTKANDPIKIHCKFNIDHIFIVLIYMVKSIAASTWLKQIFISFFYFKTAN